MRITEVESTDLFTGSTARPLQVVRVGVAATESAEAGATVSVRVAGPAAETPAPVSVTLGGPGDELRCEVSVAVTGTAGTSLPVTVICETAGNRVSADAAVTAVEPGWTMWMVSHFHYDPVWWNTQGQFTEARLVLPDEDGALPDVRTAFELVRLHLEKARRDPDYKFVLAEVDYLKPHFDAFPHDRAYLRSLLADGRVELVGGTYNEPNTNLTGAETTIRNAVYGMGFQRGVLGAEVGSAWMLDAFGFDPGFPSLMAQAGLTSSSWARGPFHQWGPDENTRMQFPAEFEWLSPDGSGLLTAYMANHYGAGWTLHTAADLEGALAAAHTQFGSLATVAATPNVLLPVGSDHVIPARWVTDVGREWAKRYLWPRFVPAVPSEFFSAVRAASEAAPARYWIMPQTRDMNPVYTGKDVSYADTKLAARAGETAVLEGERLSTLAWLAGADYPAESLDKAWRQLAYGAHHDAITGTESDQVYLDLLAGWREAWQRGDEARRDAIAFLTAGGAGAGDADGGLAVTVANGLARTRDGMATVTVALDAPGTLWLTVLDPVSGAPLPALAEGTRWHDDGSLATVTLTFRAAGLPPLGFLRYPLRATPMPSEAGEPGEPGETGQAGQAGGAGQAGQRSGAPAAAAGTPRVCDWEAADGLTISNDAFTVTADPARGGALTSVVDRRTGRDLLGGPGNDLVLQEEYEQHPRWGEGPWHLSPKGPGVSSAAGPARVTAERSPVGSRLVARYQLGDLTIAAETILWDGAERVEFRTHVSGSIGRDHLLRVRFPARVAGGLPVYQTATAVIGRPFGAPEADVAKHWWTLDNPANHWFGLGAVARAVLATSSGDVPVALGVAEVITPDVVTDDQRPLVRDMVSWLAGAGVTATTARASGPRYGSVDVDSNLPDFRIALGGPQENAFTSELLTACDPAVAKRLDALLADGGTARLWVPADQSRAAAFAPSADLRGVRDLPVLIVAAAVPGDLDQAVAGLRGELVQGSVRADVAAGQDLAGGALADGDEALADEAVALYNRGTLGAAVTPDGTLWMSLLRACGGWPSGVWIDGDRQAAPDGSSFAWQHWSHTFSYALASSGTAGGWREAGFNPAAEEYNHELTAIVTAAAAEAPQTAAVAAGAAVPAVEIEGAENVTLSALKPFGNPLAAGRPGRPGREGAGDAADHAAGDAADDADRLVAVRLRETDGRAAVARLRVAGGVDAAWRTDLLEERAEGDGGRLETADGVVSVPLTPFETVTVAVRPSARPTPAQAQAQTPKQTPKQSAPPEPAQPVYARYWLHGKGPAPAGNVPVAVHFGPTRITLNDDAPQGRVTLTVACGPEPATGTVELIIPAELTAEVDGAPADGSPDAGALRYDLPANGLASWDVAARAAAGTATGRYFVTARITDRLGQAIEDTALVTVGEPGEPDAGLEPEELFFRLQSDVMALAGEADLELLTPELRLPPGGSGELSARVASHLGSPLRGEVQLVSPVGTWPAAGPWTQPVEAAPGGEATVRFAVTVPPTAEPGWQSWLLLKLMYFGRVRYSPAARLTVTDGRDGDAGAK